MYLINQPNKQSENISIFKIFVQHKQPNPVPQTQQLLNSIMLAETKATVVSNAVHQIV